MRKDIKTPVIRWRRADRKDSAVPGRSFGSGDQNCPRSIGLQILGERDPWWFAWKAVEWTTGRNHGILPLLGTHAFFIPLQDIENEHVQGARLALPSLLIGPEQTSFNPNPTRSVSTIWDGLANSVNLTQPRIT